MTKKELIDDFGDLDLDLPEADKGKKSEKLSSVISEDLIESYKIKVQEQLEKCSSNREVLEMKANHLAECVGIAAEIYKQSPVLDHAYQLSALMKTHTSTISQIEKMKDPKVIAYDIEKLILELVRELVNAMGIEIDKTRKQLIDKYPDDRSTITDLLKRMLTAIQPETRQMQEGFQTSLYKVLGLKK